MRYALYLVLSAVCLTTGALLTFDHISVSGVTVARVDSLAAPTADTLPSPEVATPAVPTAADYARFAKADSAWRQTYARQYTLAQLRDDHTAGPDGSCAGCRPAVVPWPCGVRRVADDASRLAEGGVR